MERDELKKNQSGYAQIRLAEPIAAKPGDRFVLRFFSPLETVGGGVILDPRPEKRKRGDADVIEGMKIKESAPLGEKIARIFMERSASFPPRDEIKLIMFNNNDAFDEEVLKLISNGELFEIDDERIVHIDYLKKTGERCVKILSAYHAENPLHSGIRKDELQSRLFRGQSQADRVIELLGELKIINLKDNFASLIEFKPKISGGHQKIRDDVLKIFFDFGFATPSYSDVEKKYEKDKKTFGQAFDSLLKDGSIVMLAPQIFLHANFLAKAAEILNTLAAEKKTVLLGDYRDALGTSRKYAVALLEYFDKKGVTVKNGDARTVNSERLSEMRR